MDTIGIPRANAIAFFKGQLVVVGDGAMILTAPRPNPASLASGKLVKASLAPFERNGLVFFQLPHSFKGQNIQADVYGMTGSRVLEAQAVRAREFGAISVKDIPSGYYVLELKDPDSRGTVAGKFRISR